MSVITSQNKATTTEWALGWVDYIPVVSTIANIAHMILRSLCKFDAKVSDYGKFLQLRDFSGHAVRSIPVINLIASAILDSRRKESGLTTFALANDETKALEAIFPKEPLDRDSFIKTAGLFAFISEDLKNSPEFAEKAVEANPYVYIYLPISLKTEELLLKAIKKDSKVFLQLPIEKQNDPELALKCIKENYNVVAFMSHAVLKKPEIYEFLKESLKDDPVSEIHELKLGKWISPYRVIQAAKDRTIHGEMLFCVSKQIKEHKEIVLNLLDTDPKFFAVFQVHLKNDINFIKECIKRNPRVCLYLGDDLVGNKEIQSCIKEAFEDKKEDKDLLAEIVGNKKSLIPFLPIELLQDDIYLLVECFQHSYKDGTFRSSISGFDRELIQLIIMDIRPRFGINNSSFLDSYLDQKDGQAYPPEMLEKIKAYYQQAA